MREREREREYTNFRNLQIINVLSANIFKELTHTATIVINDEASPKPISLAETGRHAAMCFLSYISV